MLLNHNWVYFKIIRMYQNVNRINNTIIYLQNEGMDDSINYNENIRI